jgi:PAT family beta-lactamase induction signal transducer AmpG
MSMEEGCDREGDKASAEKGVNIRGDRTRMATAGVKASGGWVSRLPEGVRPYFEREPIAAFFLGVSSGFPYAMIGATLTTRLAQDGLDKKSITAFSLAFLVYNLKFLWAWVVDGVRLPIIGRLGQRVSWLLLAGVLVIAAVANLAFVDPSASLLNTAWAAVLVGVAGATFDIVIDAYRIEILKPRQLGVGSGMVQYGWRIGSVAAGALALVLAARVGWEMAYLACAGFALPAMITALVYGEPERHREPQRRRGIVEAVGAVYRPYTEFFQLHRAFLVLLFILLHKIVDKLGQLTLRLLLDDLSYTNDEIALYDIGIGFWAYLVGIFVGGVLYSKLGMKRSVLISLILMGVSNFSFALLAQAGHSNAVLGGAIGFENFASGIGGVTVVAYFSALCDLRFTASQYALISAAASIVGRFVTGTSAGALVEGMGYVNFYLLTTVAALPGILLFWWMMRAGLVDSSIGTAGVVGEGDARADPDQSGSEPLADSATPAR